MTALSLSAGVNARPAANEVVEEAKYAGVWVFGGGVKGHEASVVGTGGVGHRRPVPGKQGAPPRIRGRRVPSHEEALEWAAKIAVTSRCPQELRELLPDPTV